MWRCAGRPWPPVVGLFQPGAQRFSYIDEMLTLPPGTVEQAALHLDRIAFGAGAAGPMAVITFQEGFSAADLLPDGGTGPVELSPEASAAARGGMLCIATPAICRQFASGDYPTLADQPAFRTARKAEAGTDAWLYTSMPGLIRLGGDDMETKGMVDALGLAHAENIVASVDADGPGLQAVLRLGEQDDGLLRLLPDGPLDIVSVVPKAPSAALMLEWHDASTLFSGFMDFVRRMDVKYDDPSAEQEIADFEQRSGVKLADFAKTIGGGLAVYLPTPGPDGMLGVQQIVGVLPLKDPGAFRDGLTGIITAATGMGPMPVTIGDKPGLQLGMLPVVVAFLDDRAVIAMDSAAVEGYIKWAASGGPAMAEKAPDASVMLFLDAGLLLKSYPRPESGAQVVLTLGRKDRDVRLGASVENAAPSVARTYVAVTAIAAAMVMPALERARSAAKEAKSRSNLHMIGLGIAMYRNAHDDQFPATLAPLVSEGYLDDASTFVDPADQHPVKHPGQDFPSSYEYVGPVDPNVPSEFILAYSRKGLYPGGRNVLFPDLSVMWFSEEDLHRPGGARGMSLGQCYQWLLDHDKGTMTDAQKARLKGFFQ